MHNHPLRQPYHPGRCRLRRPWTSSSARPQQGAENAAPAPVAVRLVLDAAPKFSAFTTAGMKFKNPQQDLRWSKFLESAFPLDLTISAGDQAMPTVSVRQFSINFRGQDLAPPGDYYPEPSAAGPGTPVKGIWINGSLPAKDLSALLSAFKVPGERAEIWIKNEFWKDGGNLKLTGEVPGGKANLTIGINLEDNTKAWVAISINWLEEEAPDNRPPMPQRRIISPAGRR